MGIRYAKSIKIGDFVKLNISKSGISATIGPKGASINLGSKGTYLNLSPSVAGIKGTGVSYRKKLTGGYGSLLGNLFNKSKDEKEEIKNSDVEVQNIDNKEIEEYYEKLNAALNIHKFADKVLSKEEYIKNVETLDNEANKQICKLSVDGDEETIESLVGSFMVNLDLEYDVKANYELEDHDLYIDLDLPELENIKDEYPAEVKGKVEYKKKTSKDIKKEYAQIVLSTPIYLAENFFNISPYIEKVIISGFTTKRNNDGDFEDDYLYSVKFTRDIFETTNFEDLDDVYDFILKFENRINFNASTFGFKSIKPYEIPSVAAVNNIIDEAIEGLKNLGYKMEKINEILPSLNEMKFETSAECLKEALKLLTSKN